VVTAPSNDGWLFVVQFFLKRRRFSCLLFVERPVTITATTALGASFSSFGQDIKPRLIRFGYGLNRQSNGARQQTLCGGRQIQPPAKK
jgi:hypothetical protein